MTLNKDAICTSLAHGYQTSTSSASQHSLHISNSLWNHQCLKRVSSSLSTSLVCSWPILDYLTSIFLQYNPINASLYMKNIFYLFLNWMKFSSMLLNWMQFIHYKFIFSQTVYWKPTTYQTTYGIALFGYGNEKVEKTLSFCFYGNVCSNEMRYNIGRGLTYKDTLARISATMKTKQVSPITLENLSGSSEKCC